MSLDITSSLIAQLGFGGLVGFVVGYAVKKILKLMLILLGLYAASLAYLAHRGFITINYDKFTEAFQSLTSMIQGGFNLPDFLTTNIPFAGSLIVGFWLGFKAG
ncbi:MAG: hypothetical protein DRJ31_02715 [Candidatus Methanomethylicota archaeon]|mgnify:CR=1 FL=1|uniref:FUN14 family protein n=1 Tax=Thermoproteota archaeon TaxID=2056631 RepID=A0A497ESQ0_9CREN|nr:MAG: hypothetical protein DRJ31_02715 [Candidatus Verstraetearchaeota archaeon]